VRFGRVIKRLFGQADTILGSVEAALPPAKLISEYKESLENAGEGAFEITDAIYGEPGASSA
jgi:hypothetical protein